MKQTNSSEKIKLSVVIGSYNRLEFLKSVIATLRLEVEKIEHEILVVDGGSTDGTVKWLVEQKDIISIIQHNRGEWRGKKIERKSWGYFMNLGFRAASGKYICMLSDDCLVIPGAITNGIKAIETAPKKASVGQVAFYWRNWPEQTNYWVGVAWGNRLFVNHGLYLRSALEEIGFIDSENFHFYHADGDLSLRLWEAGYSCIDSKDSYIEHRSDANVVIRQGNLVQQQKDWGTYSKRWQHLGKPDVDWLFREYTDPHDTAGKYWQKRRLLKGFRK